MHPRGTKMIDDHYDEDEWSDFRTGGLAPATGPDTRQPEMVSRERVLALIRRTAGQFDYCAEGRSTLPEDRQRAVAERVVALVCNRLSRQIDEMARKHIHQSYMGSDTCVLCGHDIRHEIHIRGKL